MADSIPSTSNPLREDKSEHLAGSSSLQRPDVVRDLNIGHFMTQPQGQPLELHETRIFIIKQGQVDAMVNMIDQHIEAGDLIYLGHGSIIQYHYASDDVSGCGLSLSDELLRLAIGNCHAKAFDGHQSSFVLRLKADDMDFLDQLHQLLHKQVQQAAESGQVALHIAGAFLCHVDYLWNRQEQTTRESLSREQRFFADFIQLVSQHAPSQHTIDFYASQLSITPRYLSTIIKQVSGKSAKQWIDEALATRIKIELKHSRKPIALICEELNFPNPSFFAKFFKRMTGITPLDYRR